MSKINSNTTCSGMDWNVMLGLCHQLKKDSNFKDYLFIATGCYFGLRISDLLSLRWSDVIEMDEFVIVERKTGKKRHITINENMKQVFKDVSSELKKRNQFQPNDYMFCNKLKQPMTIQYMNRRLHKIFDKYKVKAKNGSTHTLRKTFGKRVWEMDNKSERSLIYLSEIFSHSSIATTKRYIGIIQQDIVNIYLNL